jgi:cation transport protein ChaC
MLTRQAIDSGEYLDHFDSLPNLWTKDRIESSLAETMRSRPTGTDDVWIFAYGSLMWNPMVHFDRKQVATLHGWHRSFCLRMDIGRASPEMPGRMLALESGGHAHGVALKLARATMEQELDCVCCKYEPRPVCGRLMRVYGRATRGESLREIWQQRRVPVQTSRCA